MKRRFLILLNLFFASVASSQVWNQDGLNARVHQTMDLVGSQQKIFATLNIEYNLHSKCNDAFISVFTVKDKKLGTKKSHDFVKADDRNNRLNFFFDGKEFSYSAEKTIRVIYENGAEFGTLPSFDLIEKILANKGSMDVRIGNTSLITLTATQGLSLALDSAKQVCLKRMRQ